MAKDWSDDEVKALIRDSVKIVAEDRERAHYNTLHEKYGGKQAETDPPDEPGEGDPPPVKPPAEPAKKRSLWWGES